MKYLLTLVALLFLSPSLFSQCADAGNIYSFEYDGKTYEIVKELKDRQTASACAVERGGYLAEINSQAEQNAIHDSIINAAGVPVNYTSVWDGGGGSFIWIGGTDVAQEGSWLWDGDNDSVGTTFWQGQGAAGAGGGTAQGGLFHNFGGKSTGTVQEPDNFNGTQDGLGLALQNWPYGLAGEWNDINDTNKIYYVIEEDISNGIQGPNFKGLKLWPNPSQNLISINSSIKSANYNIIGIDGKTYLKGKWKQGSRIDISTLPSGNFSIHLLSKDYQEIGNFMKLK